MDEVENVTGEEVFIRPQVEWNAQLTLNTALEQNPDATPNFSEQPGKLLFSFPNFNVTNEKEEKKVKRSSPPKVDINKYDHPKWYLHEFYENSSYPSKLAFVKDCVIEEEKYQTIHLSDLGPKKKVIFLELEHTLVLVTNKKLSGLPPLCFINKEIANNFDISYSEPIYLYLWPFSLAFLNAVKECFDIIVYSAMQKKLLVFVIDCL